MKRYLSVVVCFCAFAFAKADFKIVGYLPEYTSMFGNTSSIPFDKLTHLNIAFAGVDASGNVSFSKSSQLTTIVSKAHDKNVKVLMSIGGGATKSQYGPIMANSTKRLTFLNGLLKMVDDYNLDGLDIDLEGSDITTDYDAFVIELADSLHKREMLITAALATWSGADIADKTLQAYDFINIMAYDHTGTWTPNSPGPHSSFDQSYNDLNYWIKTRSLPAEKAILGVPFYGYEFQSNKTVYSRTYKYIVSQYTGAELKDEVGTTIYYNGKNTMEDKTKLALLKGGGIMIWELSQDSDDIDKSLLEVIYNTKVVGVKEGLELEKTSFYPNPATTSVMLTNGNGEGDVEFIDAFGVSVLIMKEVRLGTSMDVSMLGKGLYFVKILTTNRQIVSSIVIK